MITVFLLGVLFLCGVVSIVNLYNVSKVATKVSTTIADYSNVKREFRAQLNMFLLCGRSNIAQEWLFEVQDLLSDFLINKSGKISFIRSSLIKIWGFDVIPLEIDEESGNILICGLETSRGVLAFSG